MSGVHPAIRALLSACLVVVAGACGSDDHPNTTPCIFVRALAEGRCLSSYKFQGESYVLCNGPYSLCTTADCQADSPTSAEAQCSCDVVTTGLSIRTGKAELGATSGLSTFSFAQFPLSGKVCPDGPLINCVNAPCSVSPGDPSTSSCTCPVVPGEQLILERPGTDVSCDILRSGAPNSDQTQGLNDALEAAEACLGSS